MTKTDNGKEIINMDNRKEKSTGMIKATAASARVFLIIAAIMLLMIGIFLPDRIGSAVTGVLCQFSDETISRALKFNIRIAPLIIAVIVLVLSRIFEYGALLQQGSDDTV